LTLKSRDFNVNLLKVKSETLTFLVLIKYFLLFLCLLGSPISLPPSLIIFLFLHLHIPSYLETLQSHFQITFLNSFSSKM